MLHKSYENSLKIVLFSPYHKYIVFMLTFYNVPVMAQQSDDNSEEKEKKIAA